MSSLDTLKIGDRITVSLPGVKEWGVPAVDQSATVTAENRDALIADAKDQVEHGGAEVTITTPVTPKV